MVKFLSKMELNFIKNNAILFLTDQQYKRINQSIEDKLDQFFEDIHYLVDSDAYSLNIKEKLFSIQKFIEINLH